MDTKSISAINCWRVVIALMFIGLLSASPAFAGKETPYRVFSTLWQEHTKDSCELTLLTNVPKGTLKTISPYLEKKLKVKGDVTYDSVTCVGGVLTKLLKIKYGKKSNEKNNFLAIQYSTVSSDFDDYLKKYPGSKFADEARTRLGCFKENELLAKAQTEKSREAYEAFASYCREHVPCSLEGCASLCEKNHALAQTIAEWYAITDISRGDNPEVYSKYAGYIERYGSISPFTEEASDSLKLNKDRYDWNVANEEDTSEAYRRYISNHEEDGKHLWQARKMAEELESWEKAVASREYNDYCEYYSEYPDGRFSDKAVEAIKEHEQTAWDDTQKKNTLKAYEDFRTQYPSGYYASEAQNKITELRLAPYKNDPPSFNDITNVGYYSHPGYSLLCLGNVDKSKTITISLTGPTGYSKQMKPGSYEWIRVKNGKYKILVQASNVENWWGNAVFENRMYADAWSTYTTFNGVRIPFDNNKDEGAMDRMVNEIKKKAEEEELNTLLYILGGK